MVVVTSSERLRRPPSFQREGKVGRGLAPAECDGEICLDGQAIFTCGKRYYAFGIAICLPTANVKRRAGACSRRREKEEKSKRIGERKNNAGY